MNSWRLSDSCSCTDKIDCKQCRYWEDSTLCNSAQKVNFIIGDADKELASKLIQSGSEHRKFLRQILVSVDITQPRYWWSEMDTYHYNVKNSTSTMHRLLNTKNPITLDYFAYDEADRDILESIVCRLEQLRQEYQHSKDFNLVIRSKKLLPEGYLQLRTITTNYEEVRNIYHQRKTHRLEEWNKEFCEWVESLPYAELLLIN